GYVAASGNNLARRYTEADDPKRLIGLDTLMQDVAALSLAGDLQGAIARCRELVARRPDMPLSYLYLGQVARQAGDLKDAVDALRKAVALAPDNAEAVALLGASLTQAGQASDASALLEQFERNHDADVEVLASHAQAFARMGRTKDALTTLSHAREIDPSNAMLVVNAATVLLIARDRQG